MMKSFLYHFLLVFAEWVSILAPLHKGRIVFCSFSGRPFGGDASFIALWLAKHHPELEVIWATKERNAVMPTGIKKCIIFNPQLPMFAQIRILFRTFFLFASAHVLIVDSKGTRLRKNRKALFVQTWHGDLPFKHIEGECCSELQEDYIVRTKKDSNYTDIIMSASSLMSDIFQKKFWLRQDCIITEFGISRYDACLKKDLNRIRNMRAKIGVKDSERLALYAPTFRDDGDMTPYQEFDFLKIKQALQVKFGGTWRILVRLHPIVSARIGGKMLSEDVVDVSNIHDGTGVFSASDLVITDVSSVIRDFITMSKPIFLFFPDYAHYISRCRSLRPLFFKLPFRRCETTDGLVHEIEEYDSAKYKEKIKSFLESENIEFYDTGVATERICKIVVDFVRFGRVVMCDNKYRLVGGGGKA